jgi:NitT/TauT family transport system permease protein
MSSRFRAPVDAETASDATVVAARLVRRDRRRTRIERIVSVTAPLLLLALWELLARVSVLDTRFFSEPSSIATSLWTLLTNGQLARDVGISLSRVVIGFVLGSVPGLLLGLVMGQSRLLRAALNPLIAATYPIPKIAILPLILLIFGLGELSKYVVIAVGAFFIVVINTMSGAMNVPAIYRDVAVNYEAGRLNRFRTVVLPAALPTVFAGIKVAWGTSLLLMVAAEFVGAKSGLGYLIWNSWQTFAIDDMYVGLIVISALGFVSLLLLDELERKLLPWRAHV